jgi:hypothetical protein
MASLLCEMKESKAQKLSLALPLMAPALLALLLFVNFPFPEWLRPFVELIVYSGLVGGIPYAVLVALLFWWGHRKSDTQFRRALILSPILMLPLFFMFIVTVGLIVGFHDDAAEVAVVLKELLLYVSFILGFGYSYVVLVLGTVFVLKRLGVVSPSPAI